MGRNIPLDLHLEHLNRLCNTTTGHLCVNKTEDAIVRCSKALGTVHSVLDMFDRNNSVHDPNGSHNRLSYEKDARKTTSNFTCI